MCKVSDKIKFCSCATTNFQTLKHYWVWHQYNKNKNVMILGEIYMPFDNFDPNAKSNKKIILKRLTESDGFDSILGFNNKDVLEIVLNNFSGGNHLTYSFQFKNGNWTNIEYCYFTLANNFDGKGHGKFKQPIKQLYNPKI